jgi:hypothetical protein
LNASHHVLLSHNHCRFAHIRAAHAIRAGQGLVETDVFLVSLCYSRHCLRDLFCTVYVIRRLHYPNSVCLIRDYDYDSGTEVHRTRVCGHILTSKALNLCDRSRSNSQVSLYCPALADAIFTPLATGRRVLWQLLRLGRVEVPLYPLSW